MSRILIVDDDPDIRHLLTSVLEAYRFTVETASNGREAVERVRVAAPDGIVLDVRMPVMDGFDALEAIRRDHPAVPIIVVSASRTGDVAREARTRGATAFLAKPIDPGQLRQILGQALGWKAT